MLTSCCGCGCTRLLATAVLLVKGPSPTLENLETPDVVMGLFTACIVWAERTICFFSHTFSYTTETNVQKSAKYLQARLLSLFCRNAPNCVLEAEFGGFTKVLCYGGVSKLAESGLVEQRWTWG